VTGIRISNLDIARAGRAFWFVQDLAKGICMARGKLAATADLVARDLSGAIEWILGKGK